MILEVYGVAAPQQKYSLLFRSSYSFYPIEIMTEIQKIEFKIVSQTFDSWNVQFRIDVTELLDQALLLHHLRRIKHELAAESKIPETHMVFDGILKKERTEEYVDVVVRIKRHSFEKGDPNIHFKEGIAQDGTHYSKMCALMDLYYLDAFEKPIMLDRIERAIREANLALELIHQDIITAKLKEVLDTQTPNKDIEIAVGRFSDLGEDAEVEFYFQAVAEYGKTDEYYSSRRVRVGDILCRLTPATIGENKGMNVVGEEIAPRKGLDIELEAESGVTLSFDGTEAIAKDEGVVVISRLMRRVKTIHGAKEIPKKVKFRVNPVLKVEGDRVLDIETSKTVEVIGNLSMGSKILTNCEIYINGDVESGSLIAGTDVIVEGEIRGSSVSSDTNVIVQGSVSDSDLKAKEQLIVKGHAKNSLLSGDEVIAGSISSSKVIAKTKAILDKIDADEDQVISTISVGMTDFFEQRIEENKKFIQRATEKLARIELVVGEDIMEHVTLTNVQNNLLKLLVKNKVARGLESKRQAATLRKLLESIPAMREMVDQKEEENITLQKRFETEKGEDNNVVVIKERIGSRTVVSVNGIEAEIPPVDGPVQICLDRKDNLIVNQGEGGEGDKTS